MKLNWFQFHLLFSSEVKMWQDGRFVEGKSDAETLKGSGGNGEERETE